jgi:hypothetical protein
MIVRSKRSLRFLHELSQAYQLVVAEDNVLFGGAF